MGRFDNDGSLFDFIVRQAEKVIGSSADSDHPTCPECGATMDFNGGSLSLGDGYWECPDCGFSFTEDDLFGD